MRIIKIEKDIVTEVKFLSDGYTLKENEHFSEVGDIGQRKLSDGTFEDVEQEEIVPKPTMGEQTLFETQYQTMLLEMNMGF